MFNLLPEKEKEKLRSEYKMRRWSVFFVFVLISGVVSIILFAPTYFVVYFEKQHLANFLEEIKLESKEIINPKVLEELSDASEIVKLLEPHTEEVFVAELIRAVLERKPTGISITSFSFEKTGGGKELRASLAGFAETREVLLEFSNELKKEDHVTDVEIPLASFTREENLDFSLQIKGNLY